MGTKSRDAADDKVGRGRKLAGAKVATPSGSARDAHEANPSKRVVRVPQRFGTDIRGKVIRPARSAGAR